MEELIVAQAGSAEFWGRFLTPAEQSFLKVAAILVAFIWGLVELRTRNKFREIVSASQIASKMASAADAGIKLLTSEVSKLNATLKTFAEELKHTAETDSASTKALNARADRHGNKLDFIENRLNVLANEVTLIKDKNVTTTTATVTTTKETT